MFKVNVANKKISMIKMLARISIKTRIIGVYSSFSENIAALRRCIRMNDRNGSVMVPIKKRTRLASFSVEIDNEATEPHELIAYHVIVVRHVFHCLHSSNTLQHVTTC